jgi:DNA-binding beta-propeller fold protein YncE
VNPRHARKSPAAKTGLFAPLRGLLRGGGSGAPTFRLAGLAVLVTAMGLFLSTTPAQAAPPNLCPSGQGAGQCGNPIGIAVNQSTGDFYVTDPNNRRISQFDEDGDFLRAFGWGVDTGAEELQVCTTTCRQGNFGAGSGQFSFELRSVAVDNDPLSASHGDVYVADSGNARVEKFGEAGNFLLTFGKEVNKTAVAESRPASEQDVCPAPGHPGDVCGAGVEGNTPGQLGNFHAPLAVDGSGDVWVGDTERVEEFSEAGAFLSEVALPEVSGAKSIGALVIDPAGDFYVINQNQEAIVAPGVRKYSSTGSLIETLDASGHAHALALDPATGDLFVSDQETNQSLTATLLSYDPAGAQTAAFGSGEVLGNPNGNGLAFADGSQRLFVASVQSFSLPEPGPLPGIGTAIAVPIAKLGATLCSELNPEGASTTFHYQYITATAFEEDGDQFGTGTLETAESASIGSDFQPHSACRPISPLEPNTEYRFRVVATNANGEVKGETAGFQTLPPAAIDSSSAAEVTADFATLEAEINPLGDPTSYSFEFLTEAKYLENGETFAGAAQAPLEPAPIGSGSADVSVSQHLQGLAPQTAYRYRVVVRNPISEAHGGPFAAPAQAFTTQGPAALSLPDKRAWEMVSPPDKRGAVIEPINEQGGPIQAAADGSALSFHTNAPTEPDPAGYADQIQVLAARGPSGWRSRDIAIPHNGATGGSVGVGFDYRFFSEDLSRAIVQPTGAFISSSSPFALAPTEASEQTAFLRTDYLGGDPSAFCATSCYRPLVSGAPGFANVPEGTEFGEEGTCPAKEAACGPEFEGATPDADHIVLGSQAPLTATPITGTGSGLYEWSAGQLQLVSVLPASEGAIGVAGTLGAQRIVRNAISADGSRVVWESAQHHLYLRDLSLQETVQLDAVQGGSGSGGAPGAAGFQTASSDGSRVFFTAKQRLTADSGAQPGAPDLYECHIVAAACQLTDLTPLSSGQPASAQGMIGASPDGTSSYFVANGALTVGEGAVVGACLGEFVSPPGAACNLYVRHDGTTKLIAVLSGADKPDWASGSLPNLTARISPDGRWLAFMSQRPLTGYDNRDAVSGERDQEVFLYDAQAAPGEALTCASCNPSGGRPLGVEYGRNGGISMPLAGGPGVWQSSDWLAANLPGWTTYRLTQSLYQSRYLSDSGRLFFNARDALVPSDTNGTGDVYQYEPPGVGDCTESSPRFVPSNGGCVSLISSGTSEEESAFLDASESGDDVFFLTLAQLTHKDIDGALDVYDARVNGGEAEPIKPVECTGDGCQRPAAPPNDPTPGSLTFHGAGNLLKCPKGGKCAKQKAKKKHHKKQRRAAGHNRGGQK